MTLVSVRVDLAELAEAVANEIKGGKRRPYNAALVATISGIPAVTEAIEAVVAATDKVDNAQHSRGEVPALEELYRKAKLLRLAVRTARAFEKEPKQ